LNRRRRKTLSKVRNNTVEKKHTPKNEKKLTPKKHTSFPLVVNRESKKYNVISQLGSVEKIDGE